MGDITKLLDWLKGFGVPSMVLLVLLGIALVVLLVAYPGERIKAMFWPHKDPARGDGKLPPTGLPSSVMPPPQDQKGSPSINFHAPVHGQVAVGDNNTQHQTIVHGPAPRELTADQMTSIPGELTPFGRLRANIFAYNLGDPEIVNISRQLQRVLEASGWMVTAVSGTEQGESRSDRPLPGLLIEVGPKTAVRDQEAAASALGAALRAAGITVDGPRAYDGWARGGMMIQGCEDADAALHITIGKAR